jgi:ABC-2 type transport system permease protein
MSDMTGTEPEPGAPLSATRAIALVAGRELRVRLRTRAYVIFTLLMLVGIVGLSLAVKIIGAQSASDFGYLPDATAMVEPFKGAAAAVGEEVTAVAVPDRAEGERLLRDGKIDVLLVGPTDSVHVVVRKEVSQELSQALTVVAQQQVLNQQITAAGGDPAAVRAAVAAASVDLARLEPAEPFRAQRTAIGIVAGVLVYLALLVYGQVVAQGVVEEKANRIVELLLTAIRPAQLITGKVVGIGAAGLLQMLVWVGGGVAVAIAADVLTLPSSVATGAALWAVVWFLVGFVLYAFLFAASASLVSRQEDVGGVTMPVMMLIIIPYIMGISILPADPDNGLMALLSLIPFFAPMLMPVRIAMGSATDWQMWLSLGLAVATAIGLAWLAGRIYGNAVLRAGAKVKLRDALRVP